MVELEHATDRARKVIHLRIDPNDETMTLAEVLTKVTELQRRHPEREVFWDGDEYAICSLPKRTRAVTPAH